MITHIRIRNFKRFDEVNFELGKNVVLIGPNNSGKTTALQALALWEIGLKQWLSIRGLEAASSKRPGVTINRKDLISIPTPSARLLWRDLHTRDARIVNGKQQTKNVRVDIIVEGETIDKTWECGLEFDYANTESFYCRPLGINSNKPSKRMRIPEEVGKLQFASLPPMSGLAAVEPKLEPGRLNVLIGEGQTAQVLRNLCYQIYENDILWDELSKHILDLFGVDLRPPKYIQERGEITMTYKENNVELDIANSGRGLQQILLLLCYLYSHPNTVLLLDEPDAHLEILRQRQIYHLITEIADRQESQIIAASHSEVLLNEAVSRDVVIAFVGKPHRISDRGTQVLKSLRTIGYDQYSQAKQVGWVLYLEGSTDLAILRTFAETLQHKATTYLARPFVHYVSDKPNKAREHFFALKEATPDLKAIAIFDRLETAPESHEQFMEIRWEKREIENYLCSEEVLLSYARGKPKDDLFEREESERRERIMKENLAEIGDALKTLGYDPWSTDIKASDDFLDKLFVRYYNKLGLSNKMRKSNYHILASLVSEDKIDSEVKEKLDAIVSVAETAVVDQ